MRTMNRIARIATLALASVLVAASVSAQKIQMTFPGLAERAVQSVDINLDGAMLRLAGKFLSNEESDERQVKEMISRLQGIYVKSYTFDTDGVWDQAAVDKVRAQLGPSWQRIVMVRDKNGDDVDIYTQVVNEKIAGMVVIATEPREMTIVNIVGPIDLEMLAGLQGQFGIPKLPNETKPETKGERP